MNKLKGFISKIERSGNISIVEVCVAGEKIYSIILGNKGNYVVPGKEIIVMFKETEVSIAKDFSGKISLKNKFICEVLNIKKGKLLTEVTLQWKNNIIRSIITTSSAENLELKTGDIVTAFVKTNEISLMEI